MVQSLMLKLPVERALQLKQLAKSRGLSITDLIGEMVRAEFRTRNIIYEIPGYKIYVSGGKIRFDVADVKTFRLRPNEAAKIAESLERTAVSGGVITMTVDGADLKISRIGGGVSLQVLDRDGSKSRRVTTPGIVQDLVEQLRGAISQHARDEALEKKLGLRK
jgi:hypothetical protein